MKARALLVGIIAWAVVFGALSCSQSKQTQPQTSSKLQTEHRTVNEAAQIASADVGLHEAMIDYAEQINTLGDGPYCNVYAGNRAFRYEARGKGACHVVEGTIGNLNGLELRIAGDETVYQVWVSFAK